MRLYLCWQCVLDQQDILTPLQEAWLDAGPILAPWSVNLWAVCEALAESLHLPPVTPCAASNCRLCMSGAEHRPSPSTLLALQYLSSVCIFLCVCMFACMRVCLQGGIGEGGV